MPGRVAKKPIKFSFDETHVLMSQRKDKSLKKMSQKNRKALSRNNKKQKVENQKDTEKENVNKGVKDQKNGEKSAKMIFVALIFH